jgi:hypothetical protein
MAGKEHFNYRDLTFMVAPTPDLFKSDESVGRELLELETRALGASADRKPDEIAFALGADDYDRYVASRVDPNTEVSTAEVKRRYGPNQQYFDPLTALALDNKNNVIGVAYNAQNVWDPDEQVRRQKREATIPLRLWSWYQMIAVDPEQQGRGIAIGLGTLISYSRRRFQPTSAYAWDLPGTAIMLQRAGMHPDGESEDDYPFGEGTEPIKMQRYVGRTVLGTRRRVLRLPGAQDAMKYARHMAEITQLEMA